MNQQFVNGQPQVNPQTNPQFNIQDILREGSIAPSEIPSDAEIKQNRAGVIKEQMQNSNSSFDPQTGMNLPSAAEVENAQTPSLESLVGTVPPVTQPPAVPPPLPQVDPTVPPAQSQTTPHGQPPVQPTQPVQQQPPQVDPQGQPQATDPIQQQFQQPDQTQPPVDPNQPQMTPEEQQAMNRLNELMQDPTVEQSQGGMTMEQMQQLLMSVMQNQTALAQQLQQPPQQFIPPQQPAYIPPQQDPFALQTDPNQIGAMPAIDPNQQLLLNAMQQLGNTVQGIQQQTQQFMETTDREKKISELMHSNGITREYAEKAQTFFENGQYQQGSEILQIASSPVVARKQAAADRDIIRDSAGQPLTPAQPTGVRTNPDEERQIAQIWNAIGAMKQGSQQQKLAYIQFVSKYPQHAARFTNQGQQMVDPTLVMPQMQLNQG